MKGKVLGIISLVLVLGLAGVYSYGVISTKDKFPKNTYINNIDVSGMDVSQADKMLAKSITWKELKVLTETNELGTIKADDIEFKYISNGELGDIFGSFSEWKWFTYLNKTHKYDLTLKTTYNEDNLKEVVDGLNVSEKEAEDARIEYSEQDGYFIIKKEIYGMNVSKEKLFELIKQAVDDKNDKVSLDEFIVKPEISSDDRLLVSSTDMANNYLDVTITYDFEDDRIEIIDRTLMKDWIVFEDGLADFDVEKVREHMAKLAEKYDTYGITRDFTTADGEQIKIGGGHYGWMMHRRDSAIALIDAIKAGEDKIIEPVYSYKAYNRGIDDIGKTYVEVSLDKQKVWMFVDGNLVVDTSTVTGNVAAGHATPPGVFPLNYKQKGAVLRGPGYASPVSYWMPFNGGIGLHDATWRSSFGGTIYKNNGSHGCVNLPLSSAKTIFENIKAGMPIIVY